MSTLELVLKAMNNLGGQAALGDIYKEASIISNESITESLKARLRVCICRHSSDSDVFYQNGGNHQNLFAFVGEGPRGHIWKIR